MKLETAMLSKAGGRSQNQDACGYWTSDTECCWVLADGAGGHGGGDVASKSVVRTIVGEFAQRPLVDPQAVSALIVHANEVLLVQQHSEYRLRDMRSTVAMLAVDRVRGVACWGHVGDSRIYSFRDARLRFQSRDDSVVQSMIDAGLSDGSALREHPKRALLLAALGSRQAIQPSVPTAAESVRDGDVFMLCSDGLWEYVDEAIMERQLAEVPSAEGWLAALESEVLARAPRDSDNYSAIAIWLGDRGETTLITLNR